MKEPTFVIAGAQRCGTTWLHRVLDQHPDVYMAKPVRPEPKFFLAPVGELDREAYLRTWFSPATRERAVGEKSTSYLDAPEVPERMQALFPELRVVCILRHPVERALSHYRFSAENGLETLPLDKALRGEAGRAPVKGVSVHPFAYRARGRYVEALRPFARVLGRRRLHLLIAEHVHARPFEELARLFGFLGVDASFRPSLPREPENALDWGDLALGRSLLDELLAHFRASNLELAREFDCSVQHWDAPSEALLRCLRHSAAHR